MKRSLKFRKMAIRSAMVSTAWFFTAIAFGSFGCAYHSGGLCGLAFLCVCFAAFEIAESMNKFRLSRMERDYEKRMSIRYGKEVRL